MKKLLLLFIFISNLSFAQFFTNQDAEFEEKYSATSEPNMAADEAPIEEPPDDTDAPEAPIDKYFWLLPLFGIFFTIRFYKKNREPNTL